MQVKKEFARILWNSRENTIMGIWNMDGEDESVWLFAKKAANPISTFSPEILHSFTHLIETRGSR